MTTQDRITSPARSSSGSSHGASLEVALQEAKEQEDTHPFANATALLVRMHGAAGAVSRTARVGRVQSVFPDPSPWDKTDMLPDISQWECPSAAADFAFPPVIIPGLYACDQHRVLHEAFRLTVATAYVKYPALLVSFGENNMRQLAMAISSVRAGVYWFTGQEPKVKSEEAYSLMGVDGTAIVSNPSGEMLLGKMYSVAMHRGAVRPVSSSEWTFMQKLAAYAPRFFAIAALAASRQVSSMAIQLEMAHLRSLVRGSLGVWGMRELGLTDDGIWELVFVACALGYPREYMVECTMLPHFEPAVAMTTPGPVHKRARAKMDFEAAVQTIRDRAADIGAIFHPTSAALGEEAEAVPMGSEPVVSLPEMSPVQAVMTQAEYNRLPEAPPSVAGLFIGGSGASDM